MKEGKNGKLPEVGSCIEAGAKVHVIRSILPTNTGSTSSEAPNLPSTNATVNVLTKVEEEVNAIESQVSSSS